MSVYVIVPPFPEDDANSKLYEIFKAATHAANVEFKSAVKMGWIAGERPQEPLFNSISSVDPEPETVWELTVPLPETDKKVLTDLGFKVSDTPPPKMQM